MPIPILKTSDQTLEQQFQAVQQQEQAKQRIYEQQIQQQQQESTAFYTSLGYPKYAGKYQPFTVPFGQKVQKIEETPQGLQVTFQTPEEEIGLAETLAQAEVKPVIDIPRLLGVPRTPIEALTPPSMRKETVRAFAGIAGLIAPPESLLYTVGQFAGLKTPKIPTTLTGGLITSGIESLGKGQLTASRELKALSEMPPEYAAGTLIGDILVSYGISKAVGVGAKAIKGAAGFIYKESGLKYSHALYEAKQTLLGIEEALPKSPIATIKESHTAYEISEALSSLKHAIMPTKFMEVPAEGFVALPTLEEEVPMQAISAKDIVTTSKALETAKAIGVTPLEYTKAVYPKEFAAMELMGWAEAPKTVAFGLTVPRLAETTAKAIAKSPLAEALAETMWIAPSAAEKWAVRAGVIPSPEEVIVKPSEVDVGLKMVKGGRYFDIDVTRALGFTTTPYKVAAAGKFFFEKEKLPSLKDLLKETKGEMALSELVEMPVQIIEPILPKLALLPEVAAKVSVAEAIGLGTVLGIKAMRKERLKPKPLEKLSPLAAQILKPFAEEILKPEVKVTPAQRVKVKQVAAQAQALETLQLSEQIFKPSTVQIFKPPTTIITPKLPRKEEEPLTRIKRADIFGKKPKKKMAGYLYPVLPEKKLPAYMKIGLGKARKVKSATSFILGKGKKHVLQKTRHKRK